jgi:hypothetical protein
MIEKPCPWCGTVRPAKVTRVDDARGCHEWECSGCGMRWTVKDGHPGEAFAFWPADIDATLDNDLQPLALA